MATLWPKAFGRLAMRPYANEESRSRKYTAMANAQDVLRRLGEQPSP